MALSSEILSSGAFNQRITVQKDTATSADRGPNNAQLEIWDAAGSDFTCWAAFEAMPSRPGGAEYFGDEQRIVENKGLFKVRYYAATAAIGPAKHRILYNDQVWDIQRVFDLKGLKREIHIETNSIE